MACEAIGVARPVTLPPPEPTSDSLTRAQAINGFATNALSSIPNAATGPQPSLSDIASHFSGANELPPPEAATSSAPTPDIAGAILPFELLVETLSYLTPMDAYLASQVCRWWQQLLKKDDRLRAQVSLNAFVDAVAQAVLQLHVPRKQLRAHEFPFLAAWHGHFPLLQWLNNIDYKWTESTCAGAALGGHLATLQSLRENNCPWDENTCAAAAQYGHLELLQWARANGCHWNASTCYAAAERGHLEVLQWARANGCPWDTDSCFMADKGRQLEVLQWLRESGFSWCSSSTCVAAAKGGQLAVLQWLRANG